eukprot:15366072-Ditylum_brightwellii.AAC.3
MNVNKAHALLDHPDEDKKRATAKHLGWDIVHGQMNTCKSCTLGKAKQKNTPKQSGHIKADKLGQHVFINISMIKGVKNGPRVNAKRHWFIVVDEYSLLRMSNFYKAKNGIVEPTVKKISRWKKSGRKVEFVRCDNAGENRLLEKQSKSKDWKMNLKFKYTAHATPQQNHLAELAFSTLVNKGQTLMHQANIPVEIKYKVFPKAFITAMLLDGLVVIEINGDKKTCFEHFSEKLLKFAAHLRTWGDAGTIKTHKKTTPMIRNRGLMCLFVGYAIKHEGGCYEMLDPEHSIVYESHDPWPEALDPDKDKRNIQVNEDDKKEQQTNDDEELVAASQEKIEKIDEANAHSKNTNKQDKEIPIASTTMTRSDRPPQMPPYLLQNYNMDFGKQKDKEGNEMSNLQKDISLTPAEYKFYSHMQALNEFGMLSIDKESCEMEHEYGLVGAKTGNKFDHMGQLCAMIYDEAMNTLEKEDWDEAVMKEHSSFKKYKVWKAVPINEVPEDAKILTLTWAMKMKPNGVKRARLAVQGFKQQDKLHYDSQDLSAPVANNITIRMVMISIIMASWASNLLDVKGAFLNGRFQNGERLYMGAPKGFELLYPKYVLLLLLRSLYGLKQAAMQVWRELQKNSVHEV